MDKTLQGCFCYKKLISNNNTRVVQYILLKQTVIKQYKITLLLGVRKSITKFATAEKYIAKYLLQTMINKFETSRKLLTLRIGHTESHVKRLLLRLVEKISFC